MSDLPIDWGWEIVQPERPNLADEETIREVAKRLTDKIDQELIDTLSGKLDGKRHFIIYDGNPPK